MGETWERMRKRCGVQARTFQSRGQIKQMYIPPPFCPCSLFSFFCATFLLFQIFDRSKQKARPTRLCLLITDSCSTRKRQVPIPVNPLHFNQPASPLLAFVRRTYPLHPSSPYAPAWSLNRHISRRGCSTSLSRPTPQ